MTIERVKKATFLVPRKETNRLLNRFHALSAVHIEDAAKVLAPPDDAKLVKETFSAEKADTNLKKLDVMKSTFSLFILQKKGFIDSFAPVPIQLTHSELAEITSKFDIDLLYQECANISEQYRSLQGHIEQLKVEKQGLLEFAAMPFSINTALGLQKVTVAYGFFRGKDWAEFSGDGEAKELLAWDMVRAAKKETRVLIAFLNGDADAARELLRKHGFVEIALPRLPGEVADRISEADEDVFENQEQIDGFRKRVLELAKDSRRIEIMIGHWESEKAKCDAHGYVLNSHRMAMITGWVRVKDVPRLEKVLDSEFPEASVVYEDPQPGVDNPPVSLSLGRFSKPAQTLVNLFGLPDYYSFDPTPWMIFSYLLFFSYCFGDGIYGLMLIALSYLLARKYRTQARQNKFFMLFLYAGVGTFIFGALTGSWGGDLYSYLGEGNILQRVRDVFYVPALDPLESPINMLLLALAIGIANQFYGIILRMYKMFRKRKPLDALFDGGLWLIFLPGLILLVCRMLNPDMPAWFDPLGGVLAVAGAAGLVATQGRNEKGFAAKAITGVVSLYGVLGTYGTASFLGDVLSYSRLLALGLTTSVVAMAFNIIAGLMKEIPYVGIFIFILLVAMGHTYNFFVSILTSFVHSARLVFLEFFNRFFEGGAREFKPLSFNSDRVELISDSSGVGDSSKARYPMAQNVCA